MKKSLAIICAVAVLITTLCGTLLLSSANTTGATTLAMPSFDGTLTVGQAAGAPVYVTENQPMTVVENTSNLPLANLFKYTQESLGASWLKGTLNFQGNSDAVGMMFYVEAPTSSHLNPCLVFYTADNKKYLAVNGNGPWYTLSEGDSEWQETAVAAQNYGINIPAGFKGYIYVPYTSASLSRNGDPSLATVSSSNPLAYFTIELLKKSSTTYGYVPVGESFVMSAPMWITSGSKGDLPAADKVSVGGTEYTYFAETLAGSEVVLPSYVDAEGNPLSLVGGEASIPTSVITHSSVKSVANKANIPYPNLFEVTKATEDATSNFFMYHKPVEGKGALFYVETPDATGNDFLFCPYLIHEYGSCYQYGLYGSDKFYVLAKGDETWTGIDVADYGIRLNDFKGYVYIPFVSLSVGTPIIDGVKAKGFQIWVKQGGSLIPEGDSFIISAPAIVQGDLDASRTEVVLPDAKTVNDGTNEYNYFPATKTEHTANELMIVNPAQFNAELTVGTVAPTTVVAAPGTNVAHTVVAAPGGLTKLPAVQVSYSASAEACILSYNNMLKKPAAKAVGFMNYYKLSSEARKLRFTIKAYDMNGNDIDAYIYNGKAYALADGETEWAELPINAYWYELPANFSGYVKVIFEDANFTFSRGSLDAIYNLSNVNFFTDSAIDAAKAITIGQPIHIYQDANTNICMIGQALDMSDGGADAGHVVGGGTSSDDNQGGSSSDDTSSGGSSDDTSSGGSSDDTSSGGSSDNTSSGGTSSGGSGNEQPAEHPDYKLPAYTGATIDYSDFSINKVIVARTKLVNTVGGTPVSVGAPGKASLNLADGTITVVDSICGITKHPSFKVNKDSGTYDNWLNYFTMDHDTSITKGAVELWHYIKLPAGKSGVQMNTQYNFTVKGNAAVNPYAAYVVNGKASIMAKGETEWTDVNVSSYCFTLPDGFEGYVKYTVKNLYATYGGTKDEFDADTNKELKTTVIKLFGLEATDDVYIAPTIVVTKSGVIPYAAFVDGEENAARNIFTGAVLTANDLSAFAGETGSGDLNQGAAPKVDYTIPKYTGTKYDYGNYEFARIKQFILGGNVVKGYVIPDTAYSDGHPDNTNDYTKLIDTTLGISKMPLFSITKTTGSPAELKTEPSASVANWKIDHTVEAHRKCGAVLQYIKAPADLEKVFCGIYMNAYDKDMMRKNIAPYNGVVYYMQKGTNEWVSTKITAYWFELPKGFEGYVLLETTPLQGQGGGGDWAEDWSIYNYNLRIANLNNQTVVASAPFWVEKKGDIDYAAYLNDEKNAVRNIFTGKVLKKDDVIKPLKIGDTLVKLPDYTTDFSAAIADKAALSSGTAAVEWDSIDNATKYVVRVFKKINTDDGIAYNFVAEAETTDTKATINDLELNTQYAIVVYAYDAKNNEIAVFDYINASTAAGATNAPVKPSTPTTPGVADDDDSAGFPWILVAAIAAGVIVLAAVAVVVIVIVAKKRKAKAE